MRLRAQVEQLETKHASIARAVKKMLPELRRHTKTCQKMQEQSGWHHSTRQPSRKEPIGTAELRHRNLV